jgi:FdhE protein
LLTIEERTQRIIQQLEEAAEKNPDLAAFYAFHRALLQLQGEEKAEIAATLELVDEEALKARTRKGLPLLSFDQLPIEGQRFARLATAVAALLLEQDPSLEDQPLPQGLAAWVALAERRFHEGQVTGEAPDDEGEAQEGTEATLAEMAADLALQPALQWAADQVLSHVDQQRWKRRYCPVCGGPPDLAVLEEETGARYLICARCNSEWQFQRLGCAFCGNSDYSKLFYYLGDDETYRLYVCNVCHRYLKGLDLRKARRKLLLEAERITSVAMDVAAQQEGYR